jgi:hypothetical protein
MEEPPEAGATIGQSGRCAAWTVAAGVGSAGAAGGASGAFGSSDAEHFFERRRFWF